MFHTTRCAQQQDNEISADNGQLENSADNKQNIFNKTFEIYPCPTTPNKNKNNARIWDNHVLKYFSSLYSDRPTTPDNTHIQGEEIMNDFLRREKAFSDNDIQTIFNCFPMFWLPDRALEDFFRKHSEATIYSNFLV